MYWNHRIKTTFNVGELFNNNIRCIEISAGSGATVINIKFNNNIRCIEIIERPENFESAIGLITT